MDLDCGHHPPSSGWRGLRCLRPWETLRGCPLGHSSPWGPEHQAPFHNSGISGRRPGRPRRAPCCLLWLETASGPVAITCILQAKTASSGLSQLSMFPLVTGGLSSLHAPHPAPVPQPGPPQGLELLCTQLSSVYPDTSFPQDFGPRDHTRLSEALFSLASLGLTVTPSWLSMFMSFFFPDVFTISFAFFTPSLHLFPRFLSDIFSVHSEWPLQVISSVSKMSSAAFTDGFEMALLSSRHKSNCLLDISS